MRQPHFLWVNHTGILVSSVIRYKKHGHILIFEGGSTFEKYSLGHHIGKGATSLVYLSQTDQNERVVIKRVENKREAEQESSILKSLPCHKHIITWLDFFVDNQTGYIVLAYHDGARLGQFKD